jgi:hypothetical protein
LGLRWCGWLPPAPPRFFRVSVLPSRSGGRCYFPSYWKAVRLLFDNFLVSIWEGSRPLKFWTSSVWGPYFELLFWPPYFYSEKLEDAFTMLIVIPFFPLSSWPWSVLPPYFANLGSAFTDTLYGDTFIFPPLGPAGGGPFELWCFGFSCDPSPKIFLRFFLLLRQLDTRTTLSSSSSI